jgi:hypothetical protein
MYKFTHLVVFSILILSWSNYNCQTLLDFETGIVKTGFNNIRIPNDGGTSFSLKDDLSAQSKLFFRVRASYTAKSRFTISLLYAPLKIKSRGILPRDIIFINDTFVANNTIDATYQFNSYRITYRFNIINNPKLIFGMGVTAKIRDAKIRLTSSEKSNEKTSVGMVPLINFHLWRKIKDKFGLFLNGDALFSSRGRAADIILSGTYNHSENITFRVGYRILEGGSNGSTYGFALFHYASVGISFTITNEEQNQI